MRNWFDLSSLNAKLESVKEKQTDPYAVRLTFASLEALPGELNPETVTGAGWVVKPEAPLVFYNYRRFDGLRALADAIGTILPPGKVEALACDYRVLSGIEVSGYSSSTRNDDEETSPALNEIGKNLSAHMADKDRERIMARVSVAQQQAGLAVRPQDRLFDHDAFAKWQQLSQSVGYEDATRAMLAVFCSMRRSAEIARPEHDALMEAVARGTGLPDLSYFKYSGVDKVIDKLKVDLSCNREFSEEQRYANWVIEVSGMSAGLFSNFNVHYQLFDGARFQFPRNVEPNMYGFSFRSAPALAGSMAYDAAHRMSLALSAAADAINVSEQNLFNGRRPSLHFARAVSSFGEYKTMRLKSGREMAESYAIQISPYAASTMIHKIAHAIERSRPGMLEEMVINTDLSKIVADGVGEASSKNVIQQSAYADYLRSPVEIFARTFAAGVAARLQEAGDPTFKAAGGLVGCMNVPDFVPDRAGCLELLQKVEKFIHHGPTLETEHGMGAASYEIA